MVKWRVQASRKYDDISLIESVVAQKISRINDKKYETWEIKTKKEFADAIEDLLS